MANFCAECGTHLAAEASPETLADVVESEEITDAEVRIAEINAKRDVTLARISAGLVDADRDAELAAAEATADALESVVTPPAQETPDAPVVVLDASADEPPADDVAELPEASETVSETVAEPAPAGKSSYGSSSWFGGR